MDDKGQSITYYRKFLDDWRRKIDTPRTRFQRALGSAMGNRKKTSEIQGVDGAKIKNFPFSSLRLLGFLQIGIGVTCLVFGITDLFLYLYVDPDYDDSTLSSLTIACLPIWCGLWFLVAGSMGTCMSLEQKTTLSYFKNTYMVLSILCGLLFGPVLLGVEVYIVLLRTEKADHAYEWIFPLILAFFAVNEMICAIITASICCCCSPIQQAKVRVLYTKELDEYRRPSKYQPRLSSPDIFYTKQSRMDYERGANKPPPERSRRPTKQYADIDEDEGFDSARRSRDRYEDDKRMSRDYDEDRRRSRDHEDDNRKPRDDDRRKSRVHPDERRRSRDEEKRRRSPETDDDDDVEDYDVDEFPGRREPRVSMSANSPILQRSRPETYDSQYRRLKKLVLPGNPDRY